MLRYCLAFLLMSLLLLTSCLPRERTPIAPVVDVQARQAKQLGRYPVQAGDTIYFIAWRLGLDYQRLAAANQIASPYTIRVGQQLRLPSKQTVVSATPASEIKVSTANASPHWQWPISEIKRQRYQKSSNGIDIIAEHGTQIYAAAAGQVVYSGAGIRGYGNLIIIKNNNNYMTAYAYNQHNLVKEGDSVKRGQVIASVGYANHQQARLHFEIRRRGEPVNPLSYLKQ